MDSDVSSRKDRRRLLRDAGFVRTNRAGEDVIDVEAVAQSAGISRSSVYVWIAEGGESLVARAIRLAILTRTGVV